MRQKFTGAASTSLLIKLAVCLVVTVSAGWWFTGFVTQLGIDRQNEKMMAQIHTAAASLNPVYVASDEILDTQSIEFQETLMQLRRITEVSPDIRWYYLMAEIDDQIVFTVDPDTSTEQSPPGTPYAEPADELITIFHSGIPVVTKPYKDEWGSWVSAFAPIMKDGTVAGVLGIDIEQKEWNKTVGEYRLTGLTISLLLGAIILLILVIVTKEGENLARTTALNRTLTQELKESKEKEDMLWDVDTRFRDICECSGDWIWDIDTKGKYTYISNSVRKIGFRDRELLGKSVLIHMSQKEASRMETVIRDLIEKQQPIRDLRYTSLDKHDKKNETTVEVSINAVPLFDKDKEFIGFRGISRIQRSHS